jgi:type IV pilus assembly protein PilW
MLSRKDNRGFTLAELMMAITIFSVAMASIYSAYLSQQKAYLVTEATSETQQNLRAAMYTLEREIRMAGYDPKSSKSFGFTSPLQSSVITFSYDNDENGVSAANEYSRYQRDSTTTSLQKQIGTGGSPPGAYTYSGDIAYRIDSVSFQYLDSSGIATATPSAVRAVVVTLSASRDGHTRQLSTRIQCRNMGL